MKPVASRSIWGVMLGNMCEHYDSALFGVLSPFIAPIFFPGHDALYALILTYAIIPIGMLARPVGALALGYIGDAFGRKQALVLSLGGMAMVSLLIAVIPSYARIGIGAPILLTLSRMAQNFFSAGETVGGAVAILENTPVEHRDWMSSIYSSSTVAGYLLASGLVAALSLSGSIEWAWRLLYVLGSCTGLIALYLRKVLPETVTPETTKFSQRLGALWRHREAAVLMACAAGFSYACYTIALGFINGLVPILTGIEKSTVMSLNTGLLLFDFAMLPVFGLLAQRYGREKIMMAAAGTALLSAIPLFSLISGSGLLGLCLIRIVLVSIGVAFASTYHSWAQSLVPREDRYLVCAVSYAVGCQILGSPAAALSLWSYRVTGEVTSIAWYWMFLATASILAILRARSLPMRNLALAVS